MVETIVIASSSSEDKMEPHKCKQCGNIVEYKNEQPYSISYLANFWCKTCDAWKFPHNVMEVKDV